MNLWVFKRSELGFCRNHRYSEHTQWK